MLKLWTIIKEKAVAIPAIHPGEHLSEELHTLGMSAAELARKLDVPTNRVTQILNGQRAITGDTALRLAHFFGTSPEFWLNLQTLYELRVAHQKSGTAIQSLPTLEKPAAILTKKYNRRKFVNSPAHGSSNSELAFQGPQRKDASRGARRAR
jgi:addiction module HigA family antidote